MAKKSKPQNQQKRIHVPQLDKTYALRAFIDGKRVRTHKLTTAEARVFLRAARHMARYLKRAYKL